MKPTPKVIVTVCSLCGEDWGAHGSKPTSEDCVKLLLAKIKGLELRTPVVVERPWYQPLPSYPYIQPYQRPYGPTWYTAAGSYTSTNTPAITTTCRAVAA